MTEETTSATRITTSQVNLSQKRPQDEGCTTRSSVPNQNRSILDTAAPGPPRSPQLLFFSLMVNLLVPGSRALAYLSMLLCAVPQCCIPCAVPVDLGLA